MKKLYGMSALWMVLFSCYSRVSLAQGCSEHQVALVDKCLSQVLPRGSYFVPPNNGTHCDPAKSFMLLTAVPGGMKIYSAKSIQDYEFERGVCTSSSKDTSKIFDAKAAHLIGFEKEAPPNVMKMFTILPSVVDAKSKSVLDHPDWIANQVKPCLDVGLFSQEQFLNFLKLKQITEPNLKEMSEALKKTPPVDPTIVAKPGEISVRRIK